VRQVSVKEDLEELSLKSKEEIAEIAAEIESGVAASHQQAPR
jgi:hypothetical protein